MSNATNELWDIIADHAICMVTTDDNGALRSRPMAARVDRDHKVLRFLTNRKADKVEELHNDRSVNVSFCDADDNVYASVSGQASVTTDRTMIKDLWGPYCDIWFEGDADTADVAVITVRPTQAEYWKPDEMAVVRAYEMAKAYFTDSTPDIGENKKLNL